MSQSNRLVFLRSGIATYRPPQIWEEAATGGNDALKEHWESGKFESLYPEALLWINPVDAAARSIVTGTAVRLRSRRGEVATRAHVSTDVPPGLVAMPYHFGEAAVNRVTNHEALDPLSHMPELKVCAVAVEPIE